MNLTAIFEAGSTIVSEGITFITTNALLTAVLGAGLLTYAIGKAKHILPGI